MTTMTAFTVEIPARMIALGDIMISHGEISPGNDMFIFDKVVKVEAISTDDVEINDRITISRNNVVKVVRSSDESQSAENFRNLFEWGQLA